jgi:hypothetical protein
MAWQDIVPEKWRKNPSALTFFRTNGFEYYLASLILCSLSDPKATELAFDGLVGELAADQGDLVKDWRDARWIRIRGSKRQIVRDWLTCMRQTEQYSDLDQEIGEALDTLRQLWTEKSPQ